MDQETALVNDPMFSPKAIENFSGKNEKPAGKRIGRFKNMAIETVEEKCPVCYRNHNIDECEDLKKVPVGERSKIFFRKRLCY